MLLYATCTLNRDYLGPYGEAIAFTPNLDRFASEGVVFRRHQTESGQSGISFASLFAGTQSYEHGIYHHPNRLPDELYLITEAFADAGYEPWFWSGHEMAAWDLNYGQGVPAERVFEAKPPRKRAKKKTFLQPGDPLFQRLLDRLEADPDYRAFILVNFTMTHGPYHKQLLPAEYAAFLAAYPALAADITLDDLTRSWALYEPNRLDLQWDFPATVERLGLSAADVADLARGLEVTYQADVAALDLLFGRTLDQLRERGLLDQSLIAFTADHGEILFRDNALFQWTHGLQLAPEVLAVPWILRSPLHGLQPGDFEPVTSSIDVYPTLAGLCGIDVAGKGPDGRDLSPALLGEEELEDELAFSHTTSIGPLHVDQFRGWELARTFFGSTDVGLIWTRIRDGDMVYKYRNLDGESWGVQVFDLAADPREEHDLHDPENAKHVEMGERLRGYKAMLVRRFGQASIDAPEDALGRLKRLGYVGEEDD